MPELTEESIPPAIPPRITPATWEDYPVFRETFLMYVTEPESNAALRVVGHTVYDMLLDFYHHWPGWPEGSTRTELRAALADLRHLEGYLGAVGREHEDAALTDGDTVLSLLAGRLAGELARIADEIQAALGTEA